jgi:membrane protease YdiL (CAAX protease family)
MELALALLVLWLLQSLLLQQAAEYGSLAMTAVLVVAAAQLAAIWLFRRKCPPASITAIVTIRPLRTLLPWTVACVLGAIAGSLLDALLPVDREAKQVLGAILPHWETWLSVGIVIPVIEEVIFRAIAIEWLRARLATHWAVFASSAMFAAAHGSLRAGLFAYVLGTLFGWAYAKTHSIVPGVCGHVVTNLIGLSLLLR